MSDIGRVPLWMVATVGGLAALGLLTLFFFGSSLPRPGRCRDLFRVRHKENLQGEVFWGIKGYLKGIFWKSSPCKNPRKNQEKRNKN